MLNKLNVSNVKVYDLEECIIASGYPMSTDVTRTKMDIKNLEFWLNINNGLFIEDFLKYINNYGKNIGENTKDSCSICGSNNNVMKYKSYGFCCGKHRHDLYRFGEIIERNPKYVLLDDYVEIYLYKKDKNKTEKILIDYCDLPDFFYNDWHFNKYCRSNTLGVFHRYIFRDVIKTNDIIDHINRNTRDNRRSNLRICNKKENTQNSSLCKNNTSGVMGVSFKSSRNKWRAYITIDGRSMNLGSFKIKEEAIKTRLLKEREIFKEFSPQQHLFQQYGIEPLESNNIETIKYNLKLALKHYNRIKTLLNTPLGSGHSQSGTGIRVNFDLTCTNKMWIEAERYRFLEFVSSQSTMHCISKFNLHEQYNEYVDPRVIEIMEELKNRYNETGDKEDYLRLLYTNPCGFELTARLTTNYRALKTIYSQRKNHKLPEWREFCKWVETLPYAKEFIIGE